MELKETGHSYYCEVNEEWRTSHSEYDTWDDFKENYCDGLENLDDDYNFLFRFDIKPHITEDGGTTGYELVLCFMQQRHGKFSPVIILSISENDMPEIEEWLNGRWDYMKQIWSEFSNK